MGTWVGEVPVGITSNAPLFAPEKMLELLRQPAPEPEVLVLTPISGYPNTTGLMGGARMIVGPRDLTIAVSKLAQEWDKLLAVCLIYDALVAPLRLHHVGFKYSTENEFIKAASLYAEGMARPAVDHKRIYVPQKPGRSHYYRELQLFPKGSTWEGGPRKHWDYVTEDPDGFLWFVAKAFGQEPVFWDSEVNSPIGMVAILDDHGNPLTVMARSKWWTV